MDKSKIDELFLDKHKVTDELVEYYRNNPKELDLILDQEDFDKRFLSYFFVFGFILSVSSRVLGYFFTDIWGGFFNDVILDLISELGIAIFGGAITAYLLGNLQKKQYNENLAFRNKIKERLTESDTAPPPNLRKDT